MAPIKAKGERMNYVLQEIHGMLINLSLKTKGDCEDNRDIRVRDYACNPPINWVILNFNGIPCFDGILYKEELINSIINFEYYFFYAKITKDFIGKFVSSKFKKDAVGW